MSVLSGRSGLSGALDRRPLLVALLVGALTAGLGALLAVRPLTSVSVMVLCGGGLLLWTGLRSWSVDRGLAVLSVLAGALILIAIVLVLADRATWLVGWVPWLVAAGLALAGLLRLAQMGQGSRGQRALAVSWGAALLVFAVLTLLWQDLALVIAGFLFGMRLAALGLTWTWRAVRGTEPSPRCRPLRPSRGPGGWQWVAAAAALVLAAGSGWVSFTLREDIATPDAFYDAPEEVPPSAGELLRMDVWPGSAPPQSQVQRILHTTTDSHGEPAVASGIVILPDPLPPGPRPVVAWAHGTTGIARSCAPSLMENMFEIQGIPAVSQALDQGWVIVATDYSGHGAEGDFPYLIGQGQARSTLDSIRAARQLPGLELSDEVVIWGHSQGGHAALWTGLLAPEYTPELQIRGVAPISPAADPAALAEDILGDGQVSPALALIVAWVVIPYSAAYEDVVYEDYIARDARALVNHMAQRCIGERGLVVSALTGVALTWDRPIFDADLGGTTLLTRLAENRTLGPWPAPLLMAWGDADEVIAPELQHDYLAEVCEHGIDQPVELTWREYPGYDHMAIVEPESDFIPVLVGWTADRFAGDPAPASNCP